MIIKVYFLKFGVEFMIYVPENYVIEIAFITMYHTPLRISNFPDVGAIWCYSRNVKVYICNDLSNRYLNGPYGSEWGEYGVSTSEISGALGINGFTATPPNSYPPTGATVQKITSSNLKSSLNAGTINYLRLESDTTCTTALERYQKTGQITATLTIIGYQK